jgi:hypothetical protein
MSWVLIGFVSGFGKSYKKTLKMVHILALSCTRTVIKVSFALSEIVFPILIVQVLG